MFLRLPYQVAELQEHFSPATSLINTSLFFPYTGGLVRFTIDDVDQYQYFDAKPALRSNSDGHDAVLYGEMHELGVVVNSVSFHDLVFVEFNGAG